MAGPLLQRKHPGEGAASVLVLPEEKAVREARAGERPASRHIAAPARRVTLGDGTDVQVGIAAAPSTDGTAASGIYVPAYVGPHGALFMVVEGAPFETAAFIHRAVQHALDRDQGTAGARLLRAVREACTRLQSQTLHRYELSSLGFTALLLDGNSAHVTQLPPCQVYVVDGDGLRAVPEEPMRGAAHVGSIDGRRWEVEIDLCRINLRPGATLAVCTSTVAAGVGRTQLQAIGRLPVSQAAAVLVGEADHRSRRTSIPREALVLRMPAISAARGRLLAIEAQATVRRNQPSFGLAPLEARRGPPIEAWGLRRREQFKIPLLGALAGRLQDPPDVISPRRSRRPDMVLGVLVAIAVLAGLLWWRRSPAWNPTPAIVAEAVIAEPGVPTAQNANQLSLSGRSVLLANAVSSQRFGRLAVAGSIAYVLDNEGRIIAAPSASAGGQAAAVPVVLDQQVIDVMTRGTDVLVLERNGTINHVDPSGGILRTFPVAGATQWQRPVAAAIYATNLYVLDAGSPGGAGQIWRHNGDAEGGFGAGAQPWLQATSPVVSGDATGFAIDGDIWLSKADGTVIKLTNGRADPLKLTGLEPPIQVAGAVYTQREFRSLYVLDSAARRLVRFAKDGRYESQVAEVFPAGEHPHGLWVDETNGRALILTDVRLQEVAF